MFFGNKKLEEEIKEKNELIETLQKEMRNTKNKLQEAIRNQRKEILDLHEKFEDLQAQYAEYVRKVEAHISIDLESGAKNKRYFYDTVENLISLAKRNKTDLSLALVDVAGLDKLGNLKNQESEILQRVVHDMASHIRESDLLVRLDKTKFVLVFPQTPLDHAELVCQKLQKTISSKPILEEFYVAVDTGVTQFLENENVNSVLKRAHELLRAS